MREVIADPYIVKLEHIGQRKTATFYAVTDFDESARQFVAFATHDPAAPETRFTEAELTLSDFGGLRIAVCDGPATAWEFAKVTGYRPRALSPG